MISPRSVADRAGWADFASAKLTPSSRRRDHTTWPCATTSSVCAPLTAHGFDRALHHVSRQRCRVHRIPCPTFVTIAKRPSVGRDAMDTPVIWAEREAEYFCWVIWTGQITLIRFGKLVFARNGRVRHANERIGISEITPTAHAADMTTSTRMTRSGQKADCFFSLLQGDKRAGSQRVGRGERV
jgi:hypothetical protein